MNHDDPHLEMERYRAGEMRGDEKRRFEERVLRSTELSDELYDDISLEQSISQSSRRSSRGIPRILTWLAPVAAAAVILLAVQMNLRQPDESLVMRGSGAGVELLSPKGDLEQAPESFVWRAHPEAQRYRFELLDAEARPVFQSVVTDTFWNPTEDGPRVPLAGNWHVTPLDGLLMNLGEGSSAAYSVAPGSGRSR